MEEEPKKYGKVIKGSATIKSNVSRKIMDAFFGPGVENLKDFLVYDMLIPSLRDMTADSLIGMVETIFGRGRQKPGTTKVSYSSGTNYSAVSTGKQQANTNRLSTKYDMTDIILEHRYDAQDVLDIMGEIITEYGCVTVAKLYELVGKSSDYTAHNYGWTTLVGAKPERVVGGWVLSLPPVQKLD